MVSTGRNEPNNFPRLQGGGGGRLTAQTSPNFPTFWNRSFQTFSLLSISKFLECGSTLESTPLYCTLTPISMRGHQTKQKQCSVCVFSSHSFWTSSSMDVPAGVTQEEGHTGFLIHLLSAVRALVFLARRIQPFLSLVDREVEFCVLTI